MTGLYTKKMQLKLQTINTNKMTHLGCYKQDLLIKINGITTLCNNELGIVMKRPIYYNNKL